MFFTRSARRVLRRRRTVKCDTNLHADNDLFWDYSQLIDGRAVAPETTLGNVIGLSCYQTLKHISVVNLPKWENEPDLLHPQTSTGNERRRLPVARLNAERRPCWRSLLTDKAQKLHFLLQQEHKEAFI